MRHGGALYHQLCLLTPHLHLGEDNRDDDDDDDDDDNDDDLGDTLDEPYLLIQTQ